MAATTLHTERLRLELPAIEAVRASIESLPADQLAQVPADFLERLRNATESDPWTHGFEVMLVETGEAIGSSAFKGPPDDAGVVEIAYRIDDAHQGKGYATEAAEVVTRFAFTDERVRLVCAHTLPEPNASTRVLTKCGFDHVGEVMDPEDGRVWRWEKAPNKD